MPAIRRDLKPGETVFGGGRGAIFLGSRASSAKSSPDATTASAPPSDATDPQDDLMKPAADLIESWLASHYLNDAKK